MANKYRSRYIQYYAGSEAPKLVFPKPRRPKTSLPKEVKQQSYTFWVDPLALGGIVVSVLLCVLMVVSYVTLQQEKAELEQVTAYVTALQTHNKDLEKDYAAGYDLEMIQQAALGLGMIPMEEAEHIRISVEKPAPEESSWQRLTRFLTGLFA